MRRKRHTSLHLRVDELPAVALLAVGYRRSAAPIPGHPYLGPAPGALSILSEIKPHVVYCAEPRRHGISQAMVPRTGGRGAPRTGAARRGRGQVLLHVCLVPRHILFILPFLSGPGRIEAHCKGTCQVGVSHSLQRHRGNRSRHLHQHGLICVHKLCLDWSLRRERKHLCVCLWVPPLIVSDHAAPRNWNLGRWRW